MNDNLNTNNNNRSLFVGPSFLCKSNLILKILSRIPDRQTFIINKSPPEPFSNCKIKIKEIGEEIIPLNEYENAIIVFYAILASTNSRYVDQFFIRGRHNNLDINYLWQSCFALPKRTIRNKSKKQIVLNQTIKVIKTYTET